MRSLLQSQTRVHGKLILRRIIHINGDLLVLCRMNIKFLTAVFPLSLNGKVDRFFFHRHVFFRKYGCMFHIPGKLCLIDLQPIPGLRWELIDNHICHGFLSLSYAALHFKTNQIVHFYGIFQRKLF